MIRAATRAFGLLEHRIEARIQEHVPAPAPWAPRAGSHSLRRQTVLHDVAWGYGRPA